MSSDDLTNGIFSLIFISSKIKESELMRYFSVDIDTLERILSDINNMISHLPIYLHRENGFVCFALKKQYRDAIVPYLKKSRKLSQSALEVLAYIAYNQPVKKADIDRVRGVDSEGVLYRLRSLGLIKAIVSNEPGRAVLYITTERFLERFGLKSLADLPPLSGV